ncbi:methylated-DNA--[protein]-cysteine S-methyltransferase [Actinomadura logoneensis]|uniref:Methylated-DNA--protein-cysteine methyltransferase n=1 Tax=Actinomadura logoneensis TaxID=2293572 RepID=A0A372JEJ3_9ACTN|nr:methylated-DNA--[protein]-cysteine S-methyltransferase [Actinomadura logoneensis]RFU38435.1 methylated-DNA--[protein]-cysteine S-methyltransferase [Actinomadura logoneensis]
MTVCTTLDTPLGELLLIGEPAGDGVALSSLSMPGQKRAPAVPPVRDRDPAAFTDVVRQLEAYFAGELTAFDLAFAPSGSEFQRRVWAALDEIPYGTTVSYAAVAELSGVPATAVRAVARAIGANPLLVVRPCHRVIRSDGALSGYAAGPERKRRLLDLERVHQPA